MFTKNCFETEVKDSSEICNQTTRSEFSQFFSEVGVGKRVYSSNKQRACMMGHTPCMA